MKLDWDAGHGPVTGPLNAAVGTLAVAWAGNVAHMPGSWAGAAAGVGLLGSHIAGRRKKLTRGTLTLRAAGWLGAGGWCSWAITHSPWSQWGLGSLAAGAIGLGAAMVGAHHHEEKAAEEKAIAEAAQQRASLAGRRKEIAAEWEARIARVCHASVQIVNVEDWPALDGKPSAGFTLDGECGQGGLKWKDLAFQGDALASDAKLPEGCGVEIGPGAHRGAFLMHVSTVNALIDDIYYPDDYSPLSCNLPAPIGVRRDGTPDGPINRQSSMLIVGQRGSGKTNLMHAMVANNCRMPDSLTWVIDLNGGGLALKWMRAWDTAGRPGRPPIDWVADTPPKALAMAQALVRISKARKVGYQDREIAANDDKLPVDHEVPEIRVLNDEGAEIFSTRSRRDDTLRAIADNLIQTLEIARAAAVNETTSGLRATQDVLSDPQILKQSTFKAGMKVADDAELNYFFGYNHNASAADAPYPGCALVRDGDGQVHPVKVYRIKPTQIAEIVKATANLRPELDALSRNAAGDAYERRWDGTDHLFGAGAPLAAVNAEQLPAPEQPRGSGVTANWGKEPVAGGTQAALDQADAAIRRIREAASEATDRDPDLNTQFQNIINGGWDKPTTPTGQTVIDLAKGKKEDPRKAIVYDIVAKAGEAGIGPEAIREAIGRLYPDVEPPHAATIGRWLDADPRTHKPSYGRYAVRPDLEN